MALCAASVTGMYFSAMELDVSFAELDANGRSAPTRLWRRARR